MIKKDGKLVLECEGVVQTKRYMKFRLPEELFEDEESVVLFSGRYVYLHKGDDGEGIEEVVMRLSPGVTDGVPWWHENEKR